MPTLKEKKLLNDAVTGETKRCIAIVKRHMTANQIVTGGDDVVEIYKNIVSDIIKGTPYIKHHPELLKRIPNE
jgi:hypothetical protein